MRIRSTLKPFNYNPPPLEDGVKRIKKPLLTLDNGAEYEGEWNESGDKDGKGV